MENKYRSRIFLTRMREIRLGQIWDRFKRPFNFCWKAGLALVGIMITISLLENGIRWVKDELGLTHYYLADEDLGRNVEIRHFSNNQCAAYDRITDERLSPRVRWISGIPERDSLTVFCDKEGLRGFLNVNTGRVVIGGKYKHAWHFSEGLAAVVADNGKVGFINYDDQMVIPAIYDYVVDHDYLFEDGICVLPEGNTGKYGAIDRQGNLKLPMEYTRIFKAYDEDTWYIRKGGKCGLVDSEMNVIFEPVYDNVRSNWRDGSAYLTLDGVRQLVSFNGEVIIPFVIDESWPLEYQIHPESLDENVTVIHPYLVEVMVDYGCYGVMDSRNGKMVVPAIYSDIDMVSKDIIMAELDGDEENNALFTTSGVMIK